MSAVHLPQPPAQKATRDALVVRWSADGSRLLVLQRGSDTCEVWEATGGRLAALHATVAEFEDARFVGADGRSVLTTSVLRVQSVMWDVDSGTSAALPPCKLAPACMDCSCDGSLVAYASRPSTSDELVLLAQVRPSETSGESQGETAPTSWRVLETLPLPTRDACRVWLCRDDSAALVLDDPLGERALVMPLLSGAAALPVDLRAGKHAGAGAGAPAKRGGGSGVGARGAGLMGRCAAAQTQGGALVAVGCHDGRVIFASQDTGAHIGTYLAPDRLNGAEVAVFVEEALEPASKASGGADGGEAGGTSGGARGTAGERAAARLGRKAAVPTQRRAAASAKVAAAPSSLVVVSDETVELPREASRAPAGAGLGRGGDATRRAAGSSATSAQSTLPGGVSRLSFSASGRFVAWRDDACRRAALVGRAGGGQLITAMIAAAPVVALLWRPRGAGAQDVLVVVTLSGKTVVVTPAEGRAFLLDVGEGFAVRAAAWSPDGSKLLVHNGLEWQLGCLLGGGAGGVEGAGAE